jgi:hypothetical protein
MSIREYLKKGNREQIQGKEERRSRKTMINETTRRRERNPI